MTSQQSVHEDGCGGFWPGFVSPKSSRDSFPGVTFWFDSRPMIWSSTGTFNCISAKLSAGAGGLAIMLLVSLITSSGLSASMSQLPENWLIMVVEPAQSYTPAATLQMGQLHEEDHQWTSEIFQFLPILLSRLTFVLMHTMLNINPVWQWAKSHVESQNYLLFFLNH